MRKIALRSLPITFFFFVSCGAYFNQPYAIEDARIGELTSKTEILRDMPLPYEKLVVGVYNFKDQTGQYKNLQNGSSFSTAVSQGATTMLIQALEDSKWFTPIERENLNNLLNERNIIRSTRDEFTRNTNLKQPPLPALLYAGVLLEGGVVSYDTNVITGGAGARYFGAGASAQYRQDRISIYLRAVSTSNGKILKTVYVSKTILSQSIDASLFRYVSFQRLLEAETGFTKNEPVQLAMKDAIEKAVQSLIVEGITDGLWTSADGGLTNKKLMDAYRIEKELEESTLLYDRKQIKDSKGNGLLLSMNSPILNADLANEKFGYGGSIGYSAELSGALSLNVAAEFSSFSAGKSFSRSFVAPRVDLEIDFLPKDNFSPFVYLGGGAIFPIGDTSNSILVPKLQAGLGLNYRISTKVDLRLFAESNFAFSDELDGVTSGKRDDFYYNLGLGIKYRLKKNASSSPKNDME